MEAKKSNSDPKLVVVSGPREGQSFVLDERTDVLTLGRQEGNDLQILEAAVSRRHGEIRRRKGEDPDGSAFELVDLESSHGTFVNSVPVHRHQLAHGDFIQVGSTSLLFLSEASLGVASAQPGDSLLARSTVQKEPGEIAALVRRPDAESGIELALLLEIGTAAQELRQARALAERLLELLFERLRAEKGAVLHLAPEQDHPELWCERGRGDLHLSRTVIDEVCRRGVALLWDDVIVDPAMAGAESLRQVEVRSLLAVPMAGRRRLHGVAYFQSGTAGAFGETDLKTAAAAAGIAGLAFDTADVIDDLRAENRRLRGLAIEHDMVGESLAMTQLLSFIERVAPVDSTVLLRGESGTGKELVAHALHSSSPRADGPFVAINCATLSETLLESELFGHERGAFTGAVQRSIGKFEAADGGTLFLDEVGEIPTTVQARLLRVLQERQFQRLGGSRQIEVDVRLIAATHRDLEAAIRDGSFREDLFYRLNVIAFNVPPLRERRADIPLLARHFLRLHGERLGRPGSGLDPDTLRTLTAYDWPGNIRQLSNAIERAVVLGDGDMIRPEDLPDELLERSAGEVPLSDFQNAIAETKKQLLLGALEQTDGNAAAAARQLGLHPNSFRRLMRQLGLKDSGE